ncbi:MAG TPA: tetratricopeptide repeat protein [Planctomycetaceae bacterium]|nr:tetratricopeptide repeat protein [Planctomycetaceae bacterium]
MSSSTDPPTNAPSVASSPCLQGERVSFTGTLASMTHQQAHEVVEQHGGTATHHISKQTTMLVVGEEGWPLEPDGHPSIKLQQITQWQQENVPVRIVSESDWLRIVGLDGRCREVHSLYTPAMLCQSLNVPIAQIRRWERLGLIRPVRKVYRLPYFDYSEAAGVRRLSELLTAGIPLAQLESSLMKLQTMLPALDRPLAQLNLLAQDSRLLVRDSHGLVEPFTRQRCFDFVPPAPPGDEDTNEPGIISDRRLTGNGEMNASARLHWSADQWFEEGCRLLDEHETASAIEAFRAALMSRAGSPEINFHLAEALYRADNADGALERYYAAVEADHDYLEAWTQIGSIHAANGELESALEAFSIALTVHADYPDAHWHVADVLVQLGRPEEAAAHWRKYLEYDRRGPWAEQARQRLKAMGEEPGALSP